MKPSFIRGVFAGAVAVFFCATAWAAGAGTTVVNYAGPPDEPRSQDYTMTAEGEAVFIYSARTGENGPASFAYFDANGSVRVRVVALRAVTSALIRPLRLGVKAVVEGNAVTFDLPGPCKATLELNGSVERPLHVFVNALETDVPDPKDPNVMYFGPGRHQISSTRLKSNQTVYIAGGAVVEGVVLPGDPVRYVFQGDKAYDPMFVAEKVSHVTIRGRGILDGSKLAHLAMQPIAVTESSDVKVEGIVIRESPSWTITLAKSHDVRVSDVKEVSHFLNSDGLNSVNSYNIAVRDCFIRNYDDCIVMKTTEPGNPLHDVTVEGCVIWSDWGYALGVAYETRADVSRVTFKDCDVIHSSHLAALGVHVCDSGTISDVVFENIRVEDVRGKLFRIWIGQDMWGKDATRGHVQGLVFKNIEVGTPRAPSELTGADAAHGIEGVTFENVRVAGKWVTDAAAGNFAVNAFAKDVKFLTPAAGK